MCSEEEIFLQVSSTKNRLCRKFAWECVGDKDEKENGKIQVWVPLNLILKFLYHFDKLKLCEKYNLCTCVNTSLLIRVKYHSI